MNEVEKKFCIQIMNKMLIMHLFEPIVKYDDETDQLSSQQNSIDLNNILMKLQNDEYASTTEWKASIENLWLAPMKNNTSDSLIYSLAQEQKLWFEKHFIQIPHNNFEDWYMKINKISKEIQNLLHTPPEEVVKPIILKNYNQKKES